MSVRETGRLSTGIPGLDAVLDGGLVPGRGYMVYGAPGTGKTMLGVHFLTAGVDVGESVLYINLEETVEDIRANAATLGFDLSSVEFLDLSPKASHFTGDRAYDIFDASEVERGPLTERIVERVEALGPDRVFVDPLSLLRYLTADRYQFRKQVIAFVQYLVERDATVLFTAQLGADEVDELQFVSDGAIELGYNRFGRTLTVQKYRGSTMLPGVHALRITDWGIEVYPNRSPSDVQEDVYTLEPVSAGVPGIDELLHGGITRGTATIVSGPTGVGKTTLGTQFMKEAAGRGERSVIFLFEETAKTFLERSRCVNIPVDEMRDRRTLHVHEVEALDFSPQRFADMVRREVEEAGADLVMIDGVAGYRLMFTGDSRNRNTVREIHSLVQYLKRKGVTTILVDETHSVTGEFIGTGENISYLADTLVFLRHVEIEGRLTKVVGVLKNRTRDYERGLRRFQITEHGLKVGEPMTGLRGVLSGIPEWTDSGRRQVSE